MLVKAHQFLLGLLLILIRNTFKFLFLISNKIEFIWPFESLSKWITLNCSLDGFFSSILPPSTHIFRYFVRWHLFFDPFHACKMFSSGCNLIGKNFFLRPLYSTHKTLADHWAKIFESDSMHPQSWTERNSSCSTHNNKLLFEPCQSKTMSCILTLFICLIGNTIRSNYYLFTFDATVNHKSCQRMYTRKITHFGPYHSGTQCLLFSSLFIWAKEYFRLFIRVLKCHVCWLYEWIHCSQPTHVFGLLFSSLFVWAKEYFRLFIQVL